MWAITSSIDCEWADTKREALKIGKQYVKAGASYCWIEKFDDEGTTGETITLKEEV